MTEPSPASPPPDPEPVPTEPLPPPEGAAPAVEPPHPQGPPGFDTHEIVTWSPRTAFDHFAVTAGRFVKKNWAWIAVAYLAFAAGSLGLAILGTLALHGDLIGPFLLMITISLLPFALLLLGVRRIERITKEPWKLLFATFLLGAILAEIARAVNVAFEGPFAILGPLLGTAAFFFLVVGPVEEFSKWAAVRFYSYERPEFDEVLDGAVYGIAAGAGFAWWENWTYISNTMLQTLAEGIDKAGSIEAAISQGILDQAVGAGWLVVIVRGIGFLGHPIWAGISGYYLGLAKMNPGQRVPLIAKGLIIPILLHASFNSLLLLPGYLFETAGTDEAAQTAAGLVGLLVFVVDTVAVTLTAYWLFRKMRANNRYLRAKRLWEAQAVAAATAPAHLASGADMHPAADPRPGPAPTPSPVAHGVRAVALGRLSAARDHVTAIGRRARAEGRADWLNWAYGAWAYLDRAETFIRGSLDEAAVHRLSEDIDRDILTVRYPPDGIGNNVP